MATVQVKITDTADDGFEYLSGLETWAIAAGFSDGDGTATAFLRFLNVTVPQGATIDSATLTLNVTDVTGAPNTTLYGVDADDAAAFAAPGNMPLAATKTSASADPDPAGTGSKVIPITSIVQEIVNRVGWTSGNAMAFVVVDSAGSGFNDWFAEDLEEAGTAEATLDITYTVNNLLAAVHHHRHHNRAL